MQTIFFKLLNRFGLLGCLLALTSPYLAAQAPPSVNLCKAAKPVPHNDLYYAVIEAPHQVRIIDEGAAALQLRLEMIERAACFINLEYIIYYPDQAGRILTQALIQKKQKHPSIQIRLLLDAPPPVWSLLDAYHIQEMMENGIEVRLYNPGWNPRNLNHRNHRKLMMTEIEALSGGRNIGDHYFDLSDAHNFADRELWLQGEGLYQLQAVFEAYWGSEMVKPAQPVVLPDRRLYHRNPPSVDDAGQTHWLPAEGALEDETAYQTALAEDARHRAKAHAFITPNAQDAAILARVQEIGKRQLAAEPVFMVHNLSFLSDHPLWWVPAANVTGASAYTFMRTAETSIWLENGYFIPQENERMVLRDLLYKGVHITLLTNSREATNEFTPNTMTLWRAKAMKKQGMEVYLYTGRVPETDLPHPTFSHAAKWNTHAKTILVDERHVWIGTMNFDPRSVRRLNAEMAIIVHDDPAFAQYALQKIFKRAEEAYPMDLTGRDPRRRRERLKSARQWLKVLFVHFGLTFIESQF